MCLAVLRVFWKADPQHTSATNPQSLPGVSCDKLKKFSWPNRGRTFFEANHDSKSNSPISYQPCGVLGPGCPPQSPRASLGVLCPPNHPGRLYLLQLLKAPPRAPQTREVGSKSRSGVALCHFTGNASTNTGRPAARPRMRATIRS